MRSFLIFVIFLSCNSVTNAYQKKDSIYGIQAMRIMPVFNAGTKLTGYDTTFSYAYFRGDSIIYEFTAKKYNSENSQLKSINIIPRYVMTIGKDTIGQEFNSEASQQKRVASLDILFRNEWICSKGELLTGNIKLISTQHDSNVGSLRETYKLTDKNYTNYSGICELLFVDSLPWLQLPYNKEINNQKKMQLVKATYKFESQFYKPFNDILEGYTATFEFKKNPTSEEHWNNLRKKFQ